MKKLDSMEGILDVASVLEFQTDNYYEVAAYLAECVRLRQAWDAARGKPLMEMFKDMEAAEG